MRWHCVFLNAPPDCKVCVSVAVGVCYEIWKESVKDGVVDMLVLRGGEGKELRMHPVDSCNYPVVYSESDSLKK